MHIFHISKVMLKILQARLQHYASQQISDVQAGFRKGRGIRDQIANIHFLACIKKAGEFQKNIYLCFIDYAKAFDCVDHNCGKLLKRWEYQTFFSVFCETCMHFKKQQLEPCMEQLTGSGLRKDYDRAVYCHLVYLTYMNSMLSEMPGWMSYKLESILLGKKPQQSQVCR